MQIQEITNSIYWTGIMNPSLRVFDIVIKTDYGTTYNSYIVKGRYKTALIEVCDEQYVERLVENIKSITDIKNVDYIVLNHNEPDHSGGVAKLIDYLPNAKVVVSKTGARYIKSITNIDDMDIIVANDGDEIALGAKTLRFINAPFLHWPDSMFTYVEEDKTIFTCDFLGCHFCDPYVCDTNINCKALYLDALKVYYDAIFSPFNKHVRNGLKKIEGLDLRYVCTSHGPIITKDGMLDEVMDLYEKWSKPVVKERKSIPIFYTSAYGNTGKMATSLAEGIKSVLPDADVEVYNQIEHDANEMQMKLATCDAFALGSPTINRDCVPPVWDLLGHIDAINTVNKPCIAFGSYGWSGEGVPNMVARMKCLKMKVFGEGLKVCFVPTKEDLENAKQLGKEFAETLK